MRRELKFASDKKDFQNKRQQNLVAKFKERRIEGETDQEQQTTFFQ